jgi:AcrR family transcriptional regulator
VSASLAAGTRSEILSAAARTLAARGYHGTSVRELARAVNRSPASFYNHFESKEELLFAVHSRAFESLIARAREALALAESAELRLYAFIHNHVQTFAAHPDVMRVLVHEAAALPARRRATIREQKLAYFALGKSLVVELAGSSHDAAEIERSTYCLFGMLNWTYGWYSPELHGAPAELAKTIHRIALAGISASRIASEELDVLTARLEALPAPSLLEATGETS